jgi:hypothetical protein
MPARRTEVANELTLANLGSGAAVEKFNESLQLVIANILDPNTEARTKRKIVLEVTMVPDRDRDIGSVMVSCQAKLAPSVSFRTQAYIGKDGDRYVAFENDPKQVTFDDFVEAKEQLPSIGTKKVG